MHVYEPKKLAFERQKKKDRRAIKPSCLMIYSSGISTQTSACSLE